MKKSLLLITLLAMTSTTWAQETPTPSKSQFTKGSLVAGVNVRSVWGGLRGMRTNYIPRLHYFVSDNWSVGPELRLDWRSHWDQFTGAGVSGRYFFWKKNKLNVFGQAGLQVGQRKYILVETRSTSTGGFVSQEYTYRENIGRFNYGVGLDYMLGKAVNLELLLEKNLRNLPLGSLFGGYQPSIGFNVKLN